jgi:ABC-2 type transport system permease protein
MTLLQNTLGKNYKWWYLFVYYIKASTVYRGSAVIWMFVKLLVIFFTILIWQINIENGSKLFEINEIVTYYVMGSIIAISNGVHWNVSDLVKEGTLSKYIIQPSNIMARCIIQDFGWWFFQNCIEIFSLCSIAFLFSNFITPSNPILIILYIICGILGYFISVFFSYFLGSFAFFLTDVHGILDIQTQTNQFLSGKTIPLSSSKILQPLILLPFSYTFYHPMQIYLGKYDTNQILQTFIIGLVWCVLLWILARFVFKAGLKKNEAVGL